jgi:hypothetical protein
MTMKGTTGRPRTLTDAQVQDILAWHAQFVAVRATLSSLVSQRQLARKLGVAAGTIARVIRFPNRPRRALTQEQVRQVLEWREGVLAATGGLRPLRSLRGLARELHVSVGTIAYAIACRGVYKQLPPETRTDRDDRACR